MGGVSALNKTALTLGHEKEPGAHWEGLRFVRLLTVLAANASCMEGSSVVSHLKARLWDPRPFLYLH